MPRYIATFLAVLTVACLHGCGDAPGAASPSAPPARAGTTPPPGSARPPIEVTPIVARDGPGVFVILDIPAQTNSGVAVTSAEARGPGGTVLGHATRASESAPWSIQLRLPAPEPALAVGGSLLDGTSWQVACPATLDPAVPAHR